MNLNAKNQLVKPVELCTGLYLSPSSHAPKKHTLKNSGIVNNRLVLLIT